jgi:hypothetical protein
MRSASERGANPAGPDAKFARLGGARRVWAIDGEARRVVRLHDVISRRFREVHSAVPVMSCSCAAPRKRCGKDSCNCISRPIPGKCCSGCSGGMEATVRAYGGDLRQGLAASRDGPRAIARWTAGLRSAMNATPHSSQPFAMLRSPSNMVCSLSTPRSTPHAHSRRRGTPSGGGATKSSISAPHSRVSRASS